MVHGTVAQEVAVAAPVALVWSAYSELDFRDRCFRLPGERSSRSHELDFRIGGEEITRSTFRNVDHSEELELRSRFLALVPERRITVSSTFILDGLLRIALDQAQQPALSRYQNERHRARCPIRPKAG